MSIVSSQLIYDITEPDGSRLLHEQYTDHVGGKYSRFRRAGPGENVAASMAAHASELEVQIAEQEAERVLT